MENSRRIIEIIKEEIEALKKDGVSKEEFTNGQKHLIYKVSLGFDSLYSIADNLMDNLGCKGRIFLPEEKKAAILGITRNDLLEMANEIFDFDKATVGFMGSRDNLEKIRNAGIDKVV